MLSIDELYKSSAFVVGALFGLFCCFLARYKTENERNALVGLILQREKELIQQLQLKDVQINTLQDFINNKVTKEENN